MARDNVIIDMAFRCPYAAHERAGAARRILALNPDRQVPIVAHSLPTRLKRTSGEITRAGIHRYLDQTRERRRPAGRRSANCCRGAPARFVRAPTHSILNVTGPCAMRRRQCGSPGVDQYRRQTVQRVVPSFRHHSAPCTRPSANAETGPSCGSWRIGCTVPRRYAASLRSITP